MEVEADIAAAMPDISSDGLTYTFKLRSDVTFSNGDKVTSKDVLYSWNRAAAIQGSYATNLSAIAGYAAVSNNQAFGPSLESLLEKRDPSVTMSGLTAPDAYTVVVRLSGPAGWFLQAIAQPAVVGMIVDQNVVKSNFENWWASPATLVGTGPYKMTAHTAGQSADFAAVPRWWGSPAPTLMQVHLEIATSSAAAISKYEQGGYDLYGYDGYGPAVDDVLRIQSSPKDRSQVLLRPGNATYWVSFNLVADASRAGGPFALNLGTSARDLRMAFDLAVDRTALAKQVCQELICVPATGGLIGNGLVGYLGSGADPLGAFDPARARALMDGVDPDRTKTRGLVYTYDPENPLSGPTAQFLQSQWLANLGVTVGLQAVPHSSFIGLRLKGRFVLARDGWAADYNHPQDWFDNLWGRIAGCPDTTCTTGYDTAAYDSLLAKADAEPAAAATDDYAALSHQLINDVVYLPLYYTQAVFLIKPYVKGAGANNLFDYPWDQIQIQSH